MIPLHNFLFYCLLYAVAIATPGPGIFSIVARALGQGFAHDRARPVWASWWAI